MANIDDINVGDIVTGGGALYRHHYRVVSTHTGVDGRKYVKGVLVMYGKALKVVNGKTEIDLFYPHKVTLESLQQQMERAKKKEQAAIAAVIRLQELCEFLQGNACDLHK